MSVDDLGRGDLEVRAPEDRGPPELRALGRTFNVMADRLVELLDSQRAFVADASHQLRSPLTALRLRLENLESTASADVSAELSRAIDETDRLSRLVDGLLSLARSEGRRPEVGVIDVGTVVDDRVEMWAPLAAERHVELISDAGRDPSRWQARAVEGTLEQILDNFLSNALDATPTGGRVEVRVTREDNGVTIRVSDTGPGLDPAERRRAFDRFWRQESSQKSGSGLGLAIVAQLARASGGSAWLDASEFGGVDAVVWLVEN
jgi:signal transduction histidine kinase